MLKTSANPTARRWLASIAIGALLFCACAGLDLLGVFESLELKSLYLRFKFRGEGEIHPDIALVGISEKDVEWSQPLPWPRTFFAVMIQTLAYHGAKATAIDFVFSTPKDAEEDAVLAQSVTQCPNALTAFYFDLGNPVPDAAVSVTELPTQIAIRPERDGDRDLIRGVTPRWPLPPLCRPGQAGFINAPPEPDGTFLRLPLVIRHGGHVFPSLTLAAACRYYGVNVQDADVVPGCHILLGPPPDRQVRIPIDRQGRMIVNFTAGHRGLQARSLSFIRVIEAEQQRQSGEKPQVDLGALKDKAVLIGGLLTTGKDVYQTPLGKTFGVTAHINALSNILTQKFLRRPGPTVRVLVLAVCSLLFAALGAQASLGRGAVGSVLVLAGYLALVWVLFMCALLWIDVVAPAADMLAVYIGVVTYRFFAEEREKARIRAVFTRYLSPDTVKEVLARREDLIFEGELKQITVLLSDIRDFTTITEELGAQETVAMLNEYFEPMVRIVLEHGGAINQFVGDEILATWGAPIEKADDALNAVKAALDMRAELAALMKSREERGLKTFAIGIGINTGETKVGNIGTHDHMDYAVIGDTVNYAARLESLTKQHRSLDCPTPILMSQSTYERVKDDVDAAPIGEIPVKGKKTVSMIYKVNGLGGKAED